MTNTKLNRENLRKSLIPKLVDLYDWKFVEFPSNYEALENLSTPKWFHFASLIPEFTAGFHELTIKKTSQILVDIRDKICEILNRAHFSVRPHDIIFEGIRIEETYSPEEFAVSVRFPIPGSFPEYYSKIVIKFTPKLEILNFGQGGPLAQIRPMKIFRHNGKIHSQILYV